MSFSWHSGIRFSLRCQFSKYALLFMSFLLNCSRLRNYNFREHFKRMFIFHLFIYFLFIFSFETLNSIPGRLGHSVKVANFFGRCQFSFFQFDFAFESRICGIFEFYDSLIVYFFAYLSVFFIFDRRRAFFLHFV